jgi:hypothetical protein
MLKDELASYAPYFRSMNSPICDGRLCKGLSFFKLPDFQEFRADQHTVAIEI